MPVALAWKIQATFRSLAFPALIWSSRLCRLPS